MIIDYIDTYRDRFGVEPICRVLAEHDVAIAPSTYHARKAEPYIDADWDDAHMANAALDCGGRTAACMGRTSWPRPCAKPATTSAGTRSPG